MSENIKGTLATIALLGQMFGNQQYDRLIDRGFLYCIPCGAERKVDEDGNVEKCSECGGEEYNLYERQF